MEVLNAWARFKNKSASKLSGGLINETFLVETATEPWVLQSLHPIFAPEVCLDIETITAHLKSKKLMTPEILRTDSGEAWTVREGKSWRALSYIRGHSHEKIKSNGMAAEAGALVARFHHAVSDLQHDFRFSRGNVHDTQKHLGHLRHALESQPDHRFWGEVERLAERCFSALAHLPDFSLFPKRISHGDLKISNLLFDEQESAICLVDLDTLSYMAWPFELGDALRSWCNQNAEDSQDAVFDLQVLEAALSGYALRLPKITAQEIDALGAGILNIIYELSTRFLADALEESYFGFDEINYQTRGDHNLARAKGQLALAHSFEQQREKIEDIIIGTLQ